jgi:hypothetical protein
MDDGFENSINRMKDWHKTMIEHLNTHKKEDWGIKKGLSLYPYSYLIYV